MPPAEGEGLGQHAQGRHVEEDAVEPRSSMASVTSRISTGSQRPRPAWLDVLAGVEAKSSRIS